MKATIPAITSQIVIIHPLNFLPTLYNKKPPKVNYYRSKFNAQCRWQALIAVRAISVRQKDIQRIALSVERSAFSVERDMA